jgi:hypothetical protein
VVIENSPEPAQTSPRSKIVLGAVAALVAAVLVS